MSSVKNLMATKVPVTFLTATLPVRLEKKLKEMLLVPTEHNLIRAPTVRPEHQYFLFRTSKESLFNRAVAFVVLSSSLLLRGERRGILFVRSKEMGENLGKIFPELDFIHGEITDDQVRERMLQKWKNGRSGGWIIGTTSLIQGVDYHDVHLVVFVAAPFSMIDFVQGAGRGGRNGMPSRIVVLHAGKPFGPSKNETNDLACKDEMVKWLTQSRCRRLGISDCMDLESHACASITGAVFCDICRSDHDLKELWLEVNKFNINNLPDTLSENLSMVASMLSPVEPTQIDVAPLRPQLARPDVLLNSMKEISLQVARIQTAIECIHLLELFSPNCGICHAESDGMTMTGMMHSNHTACKARGCFKAFYDWNKPNKPNVSRLVYIEHRPC